LNAESNFLVNYLYKLLYPGLRKLITSAKVDI